MTNFDEHFDSARRHFGVALIDLHYAAADLARSTIHPDIEAGASAAFELLNREIEKLKALSAVIEQIAVFAPGDDLGEPTLQRWWPDLVRAREAESTPD